MPKGKFDDYDDDYEEENFSDEDYNDAADDWEAEAAEEEEREKTEQATKAALAEKKLQTRAPAATRAQKEEEEDEPALPEDVVREVERMRQLANDIASGGDLVSGGDHPELLADAPSATAEDMKELGQKLAEHLLTFSDEPNFDTVLLSLFESLGTEFQSVQTINDEITKVEKAVEVSKRGNRSMKKKKGAAKVAHAPKAGGGAIDLDVEDKGGAHVEEGDAFF